MPLESVVGYPNPNDTLTSTGSSPGLYRVIEPARVA